MTRSDRIFEIFEAFDSGPATADETVAAFAAIKIHGGFDADGNFTGYDYDRQEWIEMDRLTV